MGPETTPSPSTTQPETVRVDPRDAVPELIRKLDKTHGLKIELTTLMDVYNEGRVTSLPESTEPFVPIEKRYDVRLTSEAAIERLKQEGLAPATIRQLLASALANTEAEGLALGTQIKLAGHNYVFAITKEGGKRSLRILTDRREGYGEAWFDGTVFAAVSKGVA